MLKLETGQTRRSFIGLLVPREDSICEISLFPKRSLYIDTSHVSVYVCECVHGHLEMCLAVSYPGIKIYFRNKKIKV